MTTDTHANRSEMQHIAYYRDLPINVTPSYGSLLGLTDADHDGHIIWQENLRAEAKFKEQAKLRAEHIKGDVSEIEFANTPKTEKESYQGVMRQDPEMQWQRHYANIQSGSSVEKSTGERSSFRSQRLSQFVNLIAKKRKAFTYELGAPTFF